MLAEKSPETHRLHDLEQLLCSVMAAISRVEAFRGKWGAIRTKLEGFRTRVTEFGAELFAIELASSLVSSVSRTLLEALSLAGKCSSPNPADGKLRTQSDVDSIAAKIDQHVKDIEVLTKSGVGFVGFTESRSLVTRLQIGDSESRSSAMDSVLDLLYEDDMNVVVAVAQGLVPVLVTLLDSSSMEIKEKAVSAISRVSVMEICKEELVAEGLSLNLISLLLRILDSRSGFAKGKACVALQSLSFSRENARAIGSRAGIASLLEICQSGTPYSQAFAAGVLLNLSSFPENKQNFLEEEDAIHVLIGVAASGTWVAQGNAIGCLCNLVSGDEDLKMFIAREGVLECLMSFWEVVPSVKALEAAINLLKSLSSIKSIGEAIASNGFICKLAGALSCGVLSVRIAAAGTIHELGFIPKARKEMGEVGIIHELVKMLDAKMVEEKDMAVKALSSLLLSGSNRKIFIREERAIELIIELLDPSILNLDKQCLISVLGLVADCNIARKQMVAAGVNVRLLELVEMDIDGAEKLSDKLDRSKSWGLFGRR